MSTLEKLEAAYAKVEEAAKLIESTDYGIIADRAVELLAEMESALQGERAWERKSVTRGKRPANLL